MCQNIRLPKEHTKMSSIYHSWENRSGEDFEESIDIIGLDVCEFAITFQTAFPSVPTSPHSPGRVPGITSWDSVDKPDPAPYLIKHLFSPVCAYHWPSQSESARICQFEGMLLVFGTEQFEDWTKTFLIPRLVWSLNHSDGEERLLHLCPLIDNPVWFRHLR